MKLITNASQFPKRYFGLHMTEGVAEYTVAGKASRLFIGENAIKKMNSTFEGRPVYVGHVQDEDVVNLEKEADGYVVRSFFNKADGKNWVEFLVVSDAGHSAIAKGWKLSNAYSVNNSKPGGRWHNVEYEQEVTEGSYRHLAIVDNPRYEESVVFTPEQFQAYNDKKERELKQLQNSKEQEPMSGILKFFKTKKEEVTNAADLADASLEIDGKEISVKDMIAAIKNAKDEDDKKEKAKDDKDNAKKMNMDDEVEVGDEKMSVKELVKKYQALNKKNADDEDDEKKKKEKAEKKDNSKDESKGKTGEKTEEEKAAEAARFKELQNAKDSVENAGDGQVVDLVQDRLARGIAKYS